MIPRAATRTRSLLLAAAISASAPVPADGTAGPLSPALAPDPTLAPEAVVRIQLEALRHNDAADRGIEVAFRFASPANRATTGPLARFARMIRTGAYRLMLGWVAADYGAMRVEGDDAVQPVTLFGHDDAMTYVFHLRRQSGDPCRGCWMTAAVLARPAALRAVRAFGVGAS